MNVNILNLINTTEFCKYNYYTYYYNYEHIQSLLQTDISLSVLMFPMLGSTEIGINRNGQLLQSNFFWFCVDNLKKQFFISKSFTGF